jgi:membrane carboxypeptidase/penicillin-binding protein PbpC
MEETEEVTVPATVWTGSLPVSHISMAFIQVLLCAGVIMADQFWLHGTGETVNLLRAGYSIVKTGKILIPDRAIIT